MTIEEIDERIAELTKLKEARLADANALGGAIQDCSYWRERLLAEAAATSKPHLVDPPSA